MFNPSIFQSVNQQSPNQVINNQVRHSASWLAKSNLQKNVPKRFCPSRGRGSAHLQSNQGRPELRFWSQRHNDFREIAIGMRLNLANGRAAGRKRLRPTCSSVTRSSDQCKFHSEKARGFIGIYGDGDVDFHLGNTPEGANNDKDVCTLRVGPAVTWT